ncbi:hypothetical protein EHQ53_16600 [Leptospira langatensis]|uniref:Uncharacterized protein n=1 Tax=Leptospira langatensis TaxID=2484983 RepID=A0A5F1ZNI8_9LEPT|nr:hypothetical protein [Leptospira langatensis]TGK05262.1 hypothetical protein EHO57_00840 [Leptospira langatensis]TGL38398.1 hypothetical protein EHQ53_16600 [Leptospira langatensis]
MSKGYHSRSPEEFQEFLKKSREDNKNKSRGKLILFFDLILLLFIFAAVAKVLNPLAFSGQSESKEIKIQNLSFRLSSSRESTKDLPTFFLFLKNQGNETVQFPDAKDRIQVRISTSDGLNCLQDPWTLISKKVEPGSTEFYRYEPSSEAIQNLPPECKIPVKSVWNNLSSAFRGEKKRKFQVEMIRENGNVSLEIPNF